MSFKILLKEKIRDPARIVSGIKYLTIAVLAIMAAHPIQVFVEYGDLFLFTTTTIGLVVLAGVAVFVFDAYEDWLRMQLKDFYNS